MTSASGQSPVLLLGALSVEHAVDRLTCERRGRGTNEWKSHDVLVLTLFSDGCNEVEFGSDVYARTELQHPTVLLLRTLTVRFLDVPGRPLRRPPIESLNTKSGQNTTKTRFRGKMDAPILSLSRS